MKLYIIILVVIFTPLSSFSQKGKTNKIGQKKPGFDSLTLTDKESSFFFSLFNEYKEKVQENENKLRDNPLKEKLLPQLTEREADELIQAELDCKLINSELMSEYFKKMRKKIPAKKLATLLLPKDKMKAKKKKKK